MRFMLLSVLFFSSVGCGFFNKHGEFSFAVADHRDLPVLERRFFHPKRFVKPSTTPIFETDDVLWYAYRPASLDASAFYGISLQKKSLGFQEIDLRNRIAVPGQNRIIDKYERLEEGEYRLRVAYQNKVIDQIDFIIVGDSSTESIDYEKDESEI